MAVRRCATFVDDERYANHVMPHVTVCLLTRNDANRVEKRFKLRHRRAPSIASGDDQLLDRLTLGNTLKKFSSASQQINLGRNIRRSKLQNQQQQLPSVFETNAKYSSYVANNKDNRLTINIEAFNKTPADDSVSGTIEAMNSGIPGDYLASPVIENSNQRSTGRNLTRTHPSEVKDEVPNRYPNVFIGSNRRGIGSSELGKFLIADINKRRSVVQKPAPVLPFRLQQRQQQQQQQQSDVVVRPKKQETENKLGLLELPKVGINFKNRRLKNENNEISTDETENIKRKADFPWIPTSNSFPNNASAKLARLTDSLKTSNKGSKPDAEPYREEIRTARQYIRDNELMPPEKELWIWTWLEQADPSNVVDDPDLFSN